MVEAAATDGGSSGWLARLPDDVLALISRGLAPADLCNLGLTCRSLRSFAASDKLWLPQCERLRLLSPPRRLLAWRSAFSSYKCLARFLLLARPLLGLWVHQNPELGNVVFALLGFASLVACRVIPQELSSAASSLDSGPLLWAPVFEILARPDGSALFFLHGRQADADFLYPGSLGPVDPDSNVLLLEVVGPSLPDDRPRLLHSKSQVVVSRPSTRAILRSDTNITRSSAVVTGGRVLSEDSVSFGRLAFGDRRRLLELVADQVRIKPPDHLATSPLFRQGEKWREEDTIGLPADRRLALLGLHGKRRPARIDAIAASLDAPCPKRALPPVEENVNENDKSSSRRKGSLGRYLKQIIGKAWKNGKNSNNGSSMLFVKNGCSTTSESKHAQLSEFLKLSNTVGLSLRASRIKLTTYRAWPNIHDNKFALYKLPLQAADSGREYAGLWGGTFGWPPGRSSEDKPGKALFFVLLSYEECEGQRILIGTKILEGTHYVLHPNGSAMFIVKLDDPCWDQFPFFMDGDQGSSRVEIACAYNGEGIANGYGFRYPGSKPGSLFVTQSGLLVFVWKESRSVLALQRLNLEEMLKKGEKVSALPPVANFAYLTKSYSNVFANISSATNPLSLRRGMERTA